MAKFKFTVLATTAALTIILSKNVYAGSANFTSSNGYTQWSSQTIVLPNKEWKLTFNSPINDSTATTANIKIYDASTNVEVPTTITLDSINHKYIKIKPQTNLTLRKSYSLKILNGIKSSNGKLLMKPINLDFTVGSNIYAGLPSEEGLIIYKDKAYSVDYLKTNPYLVNEIVKANDFEIYYTYDVNLAKINSLFDLGTISSYRLIRKYDEMIYVNPFGNQLLYEWNDSLQEYTFQPPSINVQVINRSSAISLKLSKVNAVPNAKYFKISHSNLIKPIGETIPYLSTESVEEIDILAEDKTILATGHVNISKSTLGEYLVSIVNQDSVGNSAGNINNNGIATEDNNGFTYFVNAEDKNKLYKINFSENQIFKINEDFAQYVNVVNDWIYFSNYADSGKIYRLKTDGSQYQKLCDDRAAYLTVSGDYIYYSNHSDGGKLYRIKKDASDGIINTDATVHGNPVCVDYGNYDHQTDQVAYINIVGDWIYYSNYSDNHKPYVINKEGTFRAKLGDEWSDCLQVQGDWIYYCSDSGIISKIKKDGTGKVVPIKGQASSYNQAFHLNVYGDWIYYSNSSDGGKLYKIKLDGSGNKIKLSNDSVGYINIVNNYIYYTTTASKMYKLPLTSDGNITPIEIKATKSSNSVSKIDNLSRSVDFNDVNKTMNEIETKYLPEKVSAIMGDNTMQQLVVVWDRTTKNIAINNGVYTFKGNIIGYDKTITLALTLPSEMLNTTNKITLYNNNGRNDSIFITGSETGSGVRIKENDIVNVYSSEDMSTKLGTGKVGRDSSVLISKLDFDIYGKSIWVTVQRGGKAESKPTEIKQPNAPLFQNNSGLDSDIHGLGADGRDFTITGWIPSTLNVTGNQYIYILPTKTNLDMQTQNSVATVGATTTWFGSNSIKNDSKNTLIKKGTYDVYVTSEYTGLGTSDVAGSSPAIFSRICADAATNINVVDDQLPAKPTIKTTIMQGGRAITLDKVPALGETMWLLPASLKYTYFPEDGSANDNAKFNAAIANAGHYSKLIGDGYAKTILTPAEEGTYYLYTQNSVGLSPQSDSSIEIDNTAPNLSFFNVSDTIVAGNNIDMKINDLTSFLKNQKVNIYVITNKDFPINDTNTIANATLGNTSKQNFYDFVPANIFDSIIKGNTNNLSGSTLPIVNYHISTAGIESIDKFNDIIASNYKLLFVDVAGNFAIKNITVQRDTTALQNVFTTTLAGYYTNITGSTYNNIELGINNALANLNDFYTDPTNINPMLYALNLSAYDKIVLDINTKKTSLLDTINILKANVLDPTTTTQKQIDDAIRIQVPAINTRIKAISDELTALNLILNALSNEQSNYIVQDISSPITTNLNLKTAASNGATILWSSSNPQYLSTTGVVTRPVTGNTDATVTLTATIKYGIISMIRTFEVTVKAAP